MAVKTASFNKKRYHVSLGKLDGLHVPRNVDREIMVMADMKTLAGLITCIHEPLHAELPKLSEKTVERISKDIGRFLWRLNFRRVQETNS